MAHTVPLGRCNICCGFKCECQNWCHLSGVPYIGSISISGVRPYAAGDFIDGVWRVVSGSLVKNADTGPLAPTFAGVGCGSKCTGINSTYADLLCYAADDMGSDKPAGAPLAATCWKMCAALSGCRWSTLGGSTTYSDDPWRAIAAIMLDPGSFNGSAGSHSWKAAVNIRDLSDILGIHVVHTASPALPFPW